jgi:hypothetical protein
MRMWGNIKVQLMVIKIYLPVSFYSKVKRVGRILRLTVSQIITPQRYVLQFIVLLIDGGLFNDIDLHK